MAHTDNHTRNNSARMYAVKQAIRTYRHTSRLAIKATDDYDSLVLTHYKFHSERCPFCGTPDFWCCC